MTSVVRLQGPCWPGFQHCHGGRGLRREQEERNGDKTCHQFFLEPRLEGVERPSQRLEASAGSMAFSIFIAGLLRQGTSSMFECWWLGARRVKLKWQRRLLLNPRWGQEGGAGWPFPKGGPRCREACGLVPDSDPLAGPGSKHVGTSSGQCRDRLGLDMVAPRAP